MRIVFWGIGLVCALSVVGCQTMKQPVTQTTVDEELTIRPAPAEPPPHAIQEEPRAGFEQESPKSQQAP